MNLQDCVSSGEKYFCLISLLASIRLDDVVEFAEDMAIDIPKIYQYLGELIGPMVDEGLVELTLLAKACNPLLESGKAGVLMAEILRDSASRQVSGRKGAAGL